MLFYMNLTLQIMVTKCLKLSKNDINIYNDDGKVATSPQEERKIIQNQFKNHFHKENVTEMEKRIGEPKPLSLIISIEEIVKALTKISS